MNNKILRAICDQKVVIENCPEDIDFEFVRKDGIDAIYKIVRK